MTRLAPAARASTTLPLPSSPQWPPTIAVTGIGLSCSWAAHRTGRTVSPVFPVFPVFPVYPVYPVSLRPHPRVPAFPRSLVPGLLLNLARHLRFELPQPLSQLGIMSGQHLHGEDGGVAGAPWTDGDRRHRHPGGHLYRGEQ